MWIDANPLRMKRAAKFRAKASHALEAWLMGFRPPLSQEAPQLTSTLNLVAAGLGVSIVPESLRDLRTNDIVYLRLTGDAPQAALGLAARAEGRSAAVSNFIAVPLRIAHDHNK